MDPTGVRLRLSRMLECCLCQPWGFCLAAPAESGAQGGGRHRSRRCRRANPHRRR